VAKISPVKITVLERSLRKDLLDKYGYSWEPCPMFQDGQEFVTDGLFMPLNFCSWAWSDMEKYVQVLSHGADMSPIPSKSGLTVVCCTDGFRPVYFLLERLKPSTKA